MAADAGAAFAPAKVNLTLHVTGQRADGYHLLDSLVVFADAGDVVRLGGNVALTIRGRFGAELVADAGNSVLRAAALILPGGAPPLVLEKNLPVAAGLGGGSADAAATLRLLSQVTGRAIPADVASLGSDVTVCLSVQAQRMQGIGEVTTPVVLPEFWMVLVNPLVPVSTADVFRDLVVRDNPAMDWDGTGMASFAALAAFLMAQRNDLQAVAMNRVPVVGAVLRAIAGQDGCALARMSGSGATCFGLFARQDAAEAARLVLERVPGWWVAAGRRL